jgi:hypothetical protein
MNQLRTSPKSNTKSQAPRLLVFPKYLIPLTACLCAQASLGEEIPRIKSAMPESAGRVFVNQVLLNYDRIKSLRVAYKATNSIDGKEVYNKDRFVSRVVKIKGIKRCIENAHMTPKMHSKKDDQFYGISIYDGKSWNVYYPTERLYEVSSRFAVPPYTDKARADPIVECLGWWPPDDQSTPPSLRGNAFFINQVLKHETINIIVSENIEKVKGHDCRLVCVSGRDFLWFDKKSLVLVHRVCFNNIAKSNSYHKFSFDNFRDLGGGLFLPFTIVRTQSLTRSDCKESTDTYDVESYEVNCVEETEFEFHLDPGTLLYDRDTETVEQTNGGFDLIENVIMRCKRIVSNKSVSSGKPGPTVGVFGAETVILLESFFLILLLVHHIRRRTRMAAAGVLAMPRGRDVDGQTTNSDVSPNP